MRGRAPRSPSTLGSRSWWEGWWTIAKRGTNNIKILISSEISYYSNFFMRNGILFVFYTQILVTCCNFFCEIRITVWSEIWWRRIHFSWIFSQNVKTWKGMCMMHIIITGIQYFKILCYHNVIITETFSLVLLRRTKMSFIWRPSPITLQRKERKILCRPWKPQVKLIRIELETK